LRSDKEISSVTPIPDYKDKFMVKWYNSASNLAPTRYQVEFLAFTFSSSINPVSVAIFQGNKAEYDIYVNKIRGKSKLVSLSLSGLPPGANYVFDKISGYPSFLSKLTITTSLQTPPGDYRILIKVKSEDKTEVLEAYLTVKEAIIAKITELRMFLIDNYFSFCKIFPGNCELVTNKDIVNQLTTEAQLTHIISAHSRYFDKRTIYLEDLPSVTLYVDEDDLALLILKIKNLGIPHKFQLRIKLGVSDIKPLDIFLDEQDERTVLLLIKLSSLTAKQPFKLEASLWKEGETEKPLYKVEKYLLVKSS